MQPRGGVADQAPVRRAEMSMNVRRKLEYRKNNQIIGSIRLVSVDEILLPTVPIRIGASATGANFSKGRPAALRALLGQRT